VNGDSVASGSGGETELLAEDEVEQIVAQAASVPTAIRDRFQASVAAWRSSWRTSDARMSSDTRDYASGPEWEEIVDVGAAAVPLVLEQVATSPDGFFLLPLLERWSDRTDVVSASADNPLESQQSRGRRAIRDALS
jgi:hypothetical protein